MSTKAFTINVSFSLKASLEEEVISGVRKALAEVVAGDDPLKQTSAEREFTKAMKAALEKEDDEFMPWFIRLGMRQNVREEFVKSLTKNNDGLVFSKFSPWDIEVTPRGN